jgi:type VI secretion system secreted protein Hcp
MASFMFLKMGSAPDIKGQSQDKDHADWIEIQSFSHGFSQPTNPAVSSQSRTIEKASHQNLTVTKMTDSASTSLIKACWQGKSFDEVTIDMRRASGENVEGFEILMKGVVISNYSIGGSPGDVPYETLSFAYASVQYTYGPIDKTDGTNKGKDPATHDLVTNTVS